MNRKRIQILSPLRAANGRTEEDHIEFAERLCLLATEAGYAPFAPHVFFTRYLEDAIPDERVAGIECGLSWLLAAEEVWVWERWGISNGMKAEIAAILEENGHRKRMLLIGPLETGVPPNPIAIKYSIEIPAWKRILHDAR